MAHAGLLQLIDDPVALAVAAGVAVLAAFVAAVLVIRALRRADILHVLLAVVAGVGIVVSIEAMWQLANGPLELSGVWATFPAVIFETAMFTAAVRAERARKQHGHAGAHGVAVWLMGVVLGVVAATNGHSLPAVSFRLAAPLIVVWVWWSGLLGGTRAPGATTWLWSPRRLLIWARVIAPGERDEVTIDRTRRVRALTRCGHRAVEWPGLLGGYYRTRLAVLARASDDGMVAEAAAQVALGRRAFGLIAEASVEASAVGGGEATSEARRDADTEASASGHGEAGNEASPDASRGASGDAKGEAGPDAPKRPSGNALKLARLRERRPDITQADAIKTLKLSRATVQRNWSATAPAQPAAPVNGKRVLSEVSGP